MRPTVCVFCVSNSRAFCGSGSGKPVGWVIKVCGPRGTWGFWAIAPIGGRCAACEPSDGNACLSCGSTSATGRWSALLLLTSNAVRRESCDAWACWGS